MATVLEPSEWIPRATVAGLGALLQLCILKMEIFNRRTQDATFSNHRMEVLPIITIISGITFSLSTANTFFPYLCNIAPLISFVSVASAGCSMGFYQMERLYYCFSQSKVHNKYGYPQWIFAVMFGIGILLFIDFCIIPFFIYLPIIKCGINHKYQYYPYEYTIDGSSTNLSMWVNLNFICFALWDIVTLCLYAWKVFAINYRKSKHQSLPKAVKSRIISILNRIVILTLVYQITSFLTFINSAVYDNMQWEFEAMYALRWIPFTITSVFLSYSMFLMQSHNTKEYMRFLAVIYEYKIYWFGCCCFKDMIRNDLHSSNSMDSQDTETQPEFHKKDTLFETRNLSVPLSHIPVPKEISMDTTIVQEQDE